MPYRYLEEVATADVAFRAWAESREELFAAAAAALLEVMVDNPEEVAGRETVAIEEKAVALDLLLFAFLQELVFYKDARQLLLRVEDVEIAGGGEEWSVRADARGERIDAARHHLAVDVKAVTMHMFRVEETEKGWEATVVVDV